MYLQSSVFQKSGRQQLSKRAQGFTYLENALKECFCFKFILLRGCEFLFFCYIMCLIKKAAEQGSVLHSQPLFLVKYHSHISGTLTKAVCIATQLFGLYSPWNSPGQNTGVGSHSLLQGIFPTQGSNPGLLHCMRIFY